MRNDIVEASTTAAAQRRIMLGVTFHKSIITEKWMRSQTIVIKVIKLSHGFFSIEIKTFKLQQWKKVTRQSVK